MNSALANTLYFINNYMASAQILFFAIITGSNRYFPSLTRQVYDMIHHSGKNKVFWISQSLAFVTFVFNLIIATVCIRTLLTTDTTAVLTMAQQHDRVEEHLAMILAPLGVIFSVGNMVFSSNARKGWHKKNLQQF